MAGDTVVTKKPRKRISFNRWHSQFMQLAHNDPKSSELLRQWAFYGMLSDMLPFLLYVYVSGAPAATESRAAVKKAAGGDLADQMEDLARAIRRFDSGQQGAQFRHTLQGLAELATAKIAWGRRGSPGEAYARLPHWLSGLALILRAGTFEGPFLSPPHRKRIQTRALALLYFHAYGKSEYRKSLDVATLLRSAYQASGLREDAAHDMVQQRMRRFRKEHPKEFSSLKQLVESRGLPNDALTLSALLMLPLLNFRSP